MYLILMLFLFLCCSTFLNVGSYLFQNTPKEFTQSSQREYAQRMQSNNGNILAFFAGKCSRPLRESIVFSKQDSLKSLLHFYENQINEFRKQNKPKEQYETIQKYGDVKDSLQQQEKTQELNRLNEKQNLEKQQAIEKIKKEELAKIETAHKNRVNNLKYSGILIFIISLFILLIVLNHNSRYVQYPTLNVEC